MANVIHALANLIQYGLVTFVNVMRVIIKLMDNALSLHQILTHLLNHLHATSLHISMINKKDVYLAQMAAFHAQLVMNAHNADHNSTITQ